MEHWSDSNFYDDFYRNRFENRTTPRSFLNATYRQPDYIAEATVRLNTHGWVRETERYPEGAFHLLERPLGAGFYVSADAYAGYYNRSPRDVDAGRALVDSVSLFSHVANIGDVRSLIIHPASTTHSQLTPEQQLSAGVTPGLVRLSVGLENLDDIIADLESGFAAARAVSAASAR